VNIKLNKDIPFAELSGMKITEESIEKTEESFQV